MEQSVTVRPVFLRVNQFSEAKSLLVLFVDKDYRDILEAQY